MNAPTRARPADRAVAISSVTEDGLNFHHGGRGAARHRRRHIREPTIAYRHMIHSLIRKPGAFAGYIHRKMLFPRTVFRLAHDRLKEHDASRVDASHVRGLALAAESGEEPVAAGPCAGSVWIRDDGIDPAKPSALPARRNRSGRQRTSLSRDRPQPHPRAKSPCKPCPAWSALHHRRPCRTQPPPPFPASDNPLDSFPPARHKPQLISAIRPGPTFIDLRAVLRQPAFARPQPQTPPCANVYPLSPKGNVPRSMLHSETTRPVSTSPLSTRRPWQDSSRRLKDACADTESAEFCVLAIANGPPSGRPSSAQARTPPRFAAERKSTG